MKIAFAWSIVPRVGGIDGADNDNEEEDEDAID